MELSPAQKHLIRGLMILGVEKDAIAGIVAGLPEPEQLDEMMEWMCDHWGASTSQILKQVAAIRRNTMNPNEEDNE